MNENEKNNYMVNNKLTNKTCLLFILIFLIINVVNGIAPQKDDSTSKNITSNNIIYQEEIQKLKKEIEVIRQDSYQKIIEAYNRSCESANRLVTYITMIATIFGIIIAIAGVFIGFESIRSRHRSEEAIRTLENAKLYVSEKVLEFDKTMLDKSKEIDKRFEEFYKISTAQLSQDVEETTKKIKDIQQKFIQTDAEKKLDALERKIEVFEEIGIPDDPNLLYAKAQIFEGKGMVQESLELINKAINLSPKSTTYIRYKAQLLLKQNNIDQAINLINDLIAMEPENVNKYWDLARILTSVERYDDAIKVYKLCGNVEKNKIEKSKPKPKLSDLFNYFENCIITENFAEANLIRPQIDSSIMPNIGDPFIFKFLLGCQHFFQKREKEALSLIDEIIKLYENTPSFKIDWSYDVITPFLKLRLNEKQYSICIYLEKLLLGEISINDFSIKYRELYK